MNAPRINDPISGEIERLLRVEHEIDCILEEARCEAEEMRREAEADRSAREKDRQLALETEVAAREQEIRAAVGAEIERVTAEAAADVARYELPETQIAELADRIAELLARGGEP